MTSGRHTAFQLIFAFWSHSETVLQSIHTYLPFVENLSHWGYSHEQIIDSSFSPGNILTLKGQHMWKSALAIQNQSLLCIFLLLKILHSQVFRPKFLGPPFNYHFLFLSLLWAQIPCQSLLGLRHVPPLCLPPTFSAICLGSGCPPHLTAPFCLIPASDQKTLNHSSDQTTSLHVFFSNFQEWKLGLAFWGGSGKIWFASEH